MMQNESQLQLGLIAQDWDRDREAEQTRFLTAQRLERELRRPDAVQFKARLYNTITEEQAKRILDGTKEILQRVRSSG